MGQDHAFPDGEPEANFQTKVLPPSLSTSISFQQFSLELTRTYLRKKLTIHPLIFEANYNT